MNFRTLRTGASRPRLFSGLLAFKLPVVLLAAPWVGWSQVQGDNNPPEETGPILARGAVVSPFPISQTVESEEMPPRMLETFLWQTYLRAFVHQVDLIGRQSLRPGNLDDYQLLVLPRIDTFSETQTEALLEFLLQGGSLILIGRTGERTEDHRAPSLAHALGLSFESMLSPEAFGMQGWSLTLGPASPLTAGLPKMKTFSGATMEPVAASGSVFPVASWNDGRVASDPDNLKHLAIAWGHHGPGRFLWIGFDLYGVGGDLDSSEAFHHLVYNTLSWFHNLPTFSLAPWPYPYTRAMLFSMDVEDQFGNIRRVEALENLPPFTYFILTESADLYSDVMEEIGLAPMTSKEIAIHGTNHDVFQGQAFELQASRLQRASDYVEFIADYPAKGFRPPEEAYDFYTLQALVDAGYEYFLANPAPDRAQPQIITHDGQELVQLSMLNNDDVKMIAMVDYPPPEEVLDRYIADLKPVFDREGLYVVNLHSQYLATPKYVQVLGDFITHAHTWNPWVPNCWELVLWWRGREPLRIEAVSRTTDQLVFRLTNPGNQAIENIGVDIWLPWHTGPARIESPPGGRRILEYNREGERIHLRVPLLMPHDSLTYQILWQD